LYNNNSFTKFLELIYQPGLHPRVAETKRATRFCRWFRKYKIHTHTHTRNNNNNSGIETKREKNGKGTFRLICYKRFVTHRTIIQNIYRYLVILVAYTVCACAVDQHPRENGGCSIFHSYRPSADPLASVIPRVCSLCVYDSRFSLINGIQSVNYFYITSHNTRHCNNIISYTITITHSYPFKYSRPFRYRLFSLDTLKYKWHTTLASSETSLSSWATSAWSTQSSAISASVLTLKCEKWKTRWPSSVPNSWTKSQTFSRARPS